MFTTAVHQHFLVIQELKFKFIRLRGDFGARFVNFENFRPTCYRSLLESVIKMNLLLLNGYNIQATRDCDVNYSPCAGNVSTYLKCTFAERPWAFTVRSVPLEVTFIVIKRLNSSQSRSMSVDINLSVLSTFKLRISFG